MTSKRVTCPRCNGYGARFPYTDKYQFPTACPKTVPADHPMLGRDWSHEHIKN